jgi:hypothetical protein
MINKYQVNEIGMIYFSLDLTLTNQFKRVIASDAASAVRYQSKHRYSMDKYGIDADIIKKYFSHVYVKEEFWLGRAGYQHLVRENSRLKSA